jgi:CheY-like chemotaxis protein
MAFRILYVEDDPINAFVLEKMLSDFTVKVAQTGVECLEYCSEGSFDIVLMDINLGDPEKDGVFYLNALRQSDHGRKPVVAVTAYAMSGDRERFMKEGFDEYFSKPIEKQRLLKFMERKKIESSF